MPEVNWTTILITLITNLGGILFGFTILTLVIKGKFDILTEMMNGHFNTMVDALKDSKKTEGKVDALIEAQKNHIAVIADRPVGSKRVGDK